MNMKNTKCSSILKRVFSLTATLAVVLSLSIFVFADELPRVVDNADLLSDNEEAQLTEKIDSIIDNHKFDVVILTTDTFDGKDEVAYADDYFDYNGYGIGGDRDGLLITVNMTARRWYISTRGFGIEAFTDYGIDYIGNELAPYLTDEEYYDGFSDFIDNVDSFLTEAENGSAYSEANPYKSSMDVVVGILIAAGIGLVITVIVMLVLRGQLKTAVKQNLARNYVRNGSVNINDSRDIFLYNRVTRIEKPKDNGGGSSTHTSSSGASHGGGGGSF
jgi:uncharacterized protein